MGFSTVLIISLAAGVILIVGGGVMMYMANLVKSAYEIKVQINSDVEDRLTKMGDDLDKKSRWIKRDLLEEISKIKDALHTDSSRKFDEMVGPLMKRIEDYDALIRSEHAEWVKAIEADRASIAAMDARLKSVTNKVRKSTEEKEAAAKAAEAAAAPPAEGEAAPAAGAGAAAPAAPAAPGDAAAPPAAEAAPAKPEAPPRRTGPTPVSTYLQELGGGRR